jgi:hypothetical protein
MARIRVLCRDKPHTVVHPKTRTHLEEAQQEGVGVGGCAGVPHCVVTGVVAEREANAGRGLCTATRASTLQGALVTVALGTDRTDGIGRSGLHTQENHVGHGVPRVGVGVQGAVGVGVPRAQLAEQASTQAGAARTCTHHVWEANDMEEVRTW